MSELCLDHRPRQHRDGKSPWCRNCGLTAEFCIPLSRVKKRKK